MVSHWDTQATSEGVILSKEIFELDDSVFVTRKSDVSLFRLVLLRILVYTLLLMYVACNTTNFFFFT
jgi:hypothetical protein